MKTKTLNMSLKTNASIRAPSAPSSRNKPRSSIRTDPLESARKSIPEITSSVNNATTSPKVASAAERSWTKIYWTKPTSISHEETPVGRRRRAKAFPLPSSAAHSQAKVVKNVSARPSATGPIQKSSIIKTQNSTKKTNWVSMKVIATVISASKPTTTANAALTASIRTLTSTTVTSMSKLKIAMNA